jgi:hypothetical protein
MSSTSTFRLFIGLGDPSYDTAAARSRTCGERCAAAGEEDATGVKLRRVWRAGRLRFDAADDFIVARSGGGNERFDAICPVCDTVGKVQRISNRFRFIIGFRPRTALRVESLAAKRAARWLVRSLRRQIWVICASNNAFEASAREAQRT